ncbi:MAG: hypothetical protein MUE68_00555 [Bacteroidetes bacterium]|jgi:hypothetical protein|nr:hypothetical protein [Bacteroidota bacterium]
MARYILQISYDVLPGRREEFLSLAQEMKAHFGVAKKKDYALYELKGKGLSVVEQFVCASKEEFDVLEDDLDERGEALVDRLTGLIAGGSARYATLVEL